MVDGQAVVHPPCVGLPRGIEQAAVGRGPHERRHVVEGGHETRRPDERAVADHPLVEGAAPDAQRLDDVVTLTGPPGDVERGRVETGRLDERAPHLLQPRSATSFSIRVSTA